jgi:arabinofuranan 3-O-arabinosyltransferase
MQQAEFGSRSFLLTQPGLAVLVISCLFLGLPVLLDLAGTILPAYAERIYPKDFGNYWIGAHETLAGRGAGLFDAQNYQRLLSETFPGIVTARNWSYPPHFLLMIWPFGLLPYTASYMAFQVVTGALFWFAARRAAPHLPVKDLFLGVSGFAIVNVWAAQNGFLVGSFFLLAYAWRNTAPFVAGLMIACITVKPQLGILLPLILLLERRFVMFAGAAFGTIALLGLSAAVFGLEAWQGYFGGTAKAQQDVLTEWVGIFQWMMPTLFGGLRALGLTPLAAGIAQLPLSAAVLLAVIHLARRPRLDRSWKAALYAGATILFTPYAFVYDLGYVVVLMLAAIATQDALNRTERSLLIILAGLAPLLFIGAHLALIPAAPLMMMALFAWMFALSFRRGIDDAQQHGDILRP